MKHWTEAKIREVLDGTFTRINADGTIAVEAVDKCFKPSMARCGRPKGYSPDKPQFPWTPEEDDMLCRMRMRNRPFSEIAWLIGRSLDGTKKRYQMLRVKGAVMA